MNRVLTKTMVLVSIIFMDLLTGMEFDLFVPSFPQIQNHFHLTPFWVEALLSFNFVGYCLSLFFVGGLSDRFGRKPIILLGLSIFVLGSIFCLMTHSYYFLLIGRLLQGIGIAAPSILSFLIIADNYLLKEQQFLMAMLNGSMNVAAAIAPVIGSYLTLYFNWTGNFYALLLLGVSVLLLTLMFIPAYELPHKQERGSYLSIFKSKSLMLLIINILFIFVPYWIFVGMSPLLYIKDMGVSLTHFGYYQGIFALIFALGSVVYGLLLKNIIYEQKQMIIISMQMILFSIVCIAIPLIVNTKNPLFITVSFIPFVIAQIIPSTILYPLCVNFLPQAKAKVSALIQGGRLILSAIALQIAGYFYSGNFRNIGIIIIICILIATVTLYFVIHDRNILHD